MRDVGAAGERERGAEAMAIVEHGDRVAHVMSAGHAAASAARHRPSEARNERSEWRREGYPPEGTRPRSGLGRVARSRSDAPKSVAESAGPEFIADSIGALDILTAVAIVIVAVKDIAAVTVQRGASSRMLSRY